MMTPSSFLWPLALASLLECGAWAGPGFDFFEPLRPSRPVQVIAHRGASGQAPENTQPALVRCIEDGFEWAEIDVRLSRDGRHLVWHDPDLGKLGKGSVKVRETDLQELVAADAGGWFAPRFRGEHLLTLRQALVLSKNRLNLYLDCKDVDPGQLARDIREEGMERQVIVFDTPERLVALRAAAGHSLALMSKWRPSDGFEGWVTSVAPEAVEIDADRVTPQIVDGFGARGIRVEAKCLDAADRAADWERVEAAGVHWIQTDFPEEVVAGVFARSFPKRPALVSLHRGANRYAPENSTEAFRRAGRLGADFVEFDVRTTRDGQYFLLHDGRLDRTTDGHGPIADATAEQVRQLSAGA